MLAEYAAAMSEAAGGEHLSDCVMEDVFGPMRVGSMGELARVGRLEKALGCLEALLVVGFGLCICVCASAHAIVHDERAEAKRSGRSSP